MAKFTMEQVKKWNAGAGNGFKIDLQTLISRGEKVLEYIGEERADKTYFVVFLRFVEETIGEGWTAKRTGKQLLTVRVERYIPITDDGLCQVDFGVYEEVIGEPQNRKMFSYMQKMSHKVNLAEILEQAEKARPIEGETAKEIEPQNIMGFIEEIPTQKTTEQEESKETAENGTDEPQTTAGAFPDMFAQLAEAYVKGKTAPAPKKKTAAPSPVSKSYTEETTGEISGTPSGVQKSDTEYTEPGYHGKTSDILTVGEIAELLDGKQVRKEDGNYKRIFIATPYTDRTSLVYTQDRYQYRDAEDVNPLTPGGDFKFCGFILGKKLYTDKTPIVKKLYEDVERKLQELIPNEGTAKENAADVEKWEQERIDFTLSYNWTGEGRKAFYEDKPPKLALYTGKKEANEAEVIRYIENPEAVITEYAEAYKDNHRADIYRQYIEYNRTIDTYKAILSNPQDEAHRIKAISTSVTDQKTARIELTNGETVKTDAWAVKGIRHDGKIWEHHVAATDRQKLPKDESGRAKDITVSDIVAIYHGQRTLYRAS